MIEIILGTDEAREFRALKDRVSIRFIHETLLKKCIKGDSVRQLCYHGTNERLHLAWFHHLIHTESGQGVQCMIQEVHCQW